MKTNKKTNAKKPEAKKPYGIKAYGKWTRFATADEYKAYLEKWIDETDGHEQDRAIKALSDLLVGVKTTDTDKMPEAVPVPKPETKPLTDEEKRAKRNEYAREYYKLHRDVLKERSRLCHAKRRAADKAAKLEAEKKAAEKPSKKASKKGGK